MEYGKNGCNQVVENWTDIPGYLLINLLLKMDSYSMLNIALNLYVPPSIMMVLERYEESFNVFCDKKAMIDEMKFGYLIRASSEPPEEQDRIINVIKSIIRMEKENVTLVEKEFNKIGFRYNRRDEATTEHLIKNLPEMISQLQNRSSVINYNYYKGKLIGLLQKHSFYWNIMKPLLPIDNEDKVDKIVKYSDGFFKTLNRLETQMEGIYCSPLRCGFLEENKS